MSSSARRPHALHRSSPPPCARAAAPSRCLHRLRASRAARDGRPGGLGIRSSPRRTDPRLARPSGGQLPAQFCQIGVTRPTLGRSLGPALPIPAVEGSDRALRAPARPLGWGGGWLRATSARGGCGSGSQLPTMVRCPGTGRVPRPPWATAGGGRACHLGSPSRARTQGPGTAGRCRRPPTRPTCSAGGGWEPAGSPGAPRRFPWTGRGRSGRSPIHEQRLLGAAAGYLRRSAGTAGNSR